MQENNKERFKTFKTWSSYLPVNSVKLAEAGFYYTGVSDEVQCFTCGISINQWVAGDCPWQNHYSKNPECNYFGRCRCDGGVKCRCVNRDL